jgi:hypothetical protein
LRLPPTAITEYAVVLIADGILARSTRRRETSTGWNTAFIGANRYTLPPGEKPPPEDALHPMAFLVEKGPGAVNPAALPPSRPVPGGRCRSGHARRA